MRAGRPGCVHGIDLIRLVARFCLKSESESEAAAAAETSRALIESFAAPLWFGLRPAEWEEEDATGFG